MTIKDVQHGRVSTYTNHGCRCEWCREAVREYANSRKPESVLKRRGAMRERLTELLKDKNVYDSEGVASYVLDNFVDGSGKVYE